MDSADTISDSLSGVSTIVLLSIAMLVGCYLAGSIPLGELLALCLFRLCTGSKPHCNKVDIPSKNITMFLDYED